MEALVRPLRLCMAAAVAALLAGCAGTPDAGKPGVVVVRDSARTVWMTQEAADAAKAAEAEADARRAAARAGVAASAPDMARPSPVAAVEAPASAPAVVAPVEFPAERSIPFDFDRYDVKEPYWALVERHAQWLKADRTRRIAIEGHADDRGGAEYNLALGQRRAEAVRQMLEILGVPPAQAEAVSFGDTRPLDRSRTEEAFARNRRVELRPL